MSHYQRFIEFKKIKKFDQIELAKDAGVSKSQMSAYLRGKALNPSINFFINICEVTDISLEWWILGRGEMIYEDRYSNYIDPVRHEKLREKHLELLEKYATLAGETIEKLKKD